MHEFNYFIFGGTPSRDFGVYISGDGTFTAPERDMTTVAVPGRNGELLIDNGRYRNVSITYRCGIVRNFKTNLSGFQNMLLSGKTYKRLEDTYHPDEFYLAYVSDAVTPSVVANLKAGEMTVTFSRKPQRYLKSGEVPQTLGNIFNPTSFDALPLMRVYGAGTVTINGTTITITGSQAFTDIDFELQDAYMGTTNLNGNVSVSGYEFPKLIPGQNVITLSGVTGVITPRWYTL